MQVTRSLLPLRRALPLARRAYSTPPPPTPTPSTTALFDPNEEPALAAIGYPKLSEASRQTRGPYGWWDQQERVNFGEPVPLNDDVQSMWAPDVHSVAPFSALSQLVLAFGLVGVFAGGVYLVRAPAPALPRAYPYDGLVQELSGTSDPLYAARPTSANEVEE